METVDLMDEIRRLMDESGHTPQGLMAMALLLLNDKLECRDKSDRFEVATAALQGMLANPQIAGLDGIKESPRGVYLLDRCEQRKALVHRAVLIADDFLLAVNHTPSDIYVTGEVRRRAECGHSPVTDKFVEEIEAEVGVGGAAWDTVGARRVVEAVMRVLRRLDPRDP